MIAPEGFNEQQTQYLEGLVAGADAARSMRGLPSFADALRVRTGKPAAVPVNLTSSVRSKYPAATPAEHVHLEVQDRLLAAGKKLSKEEIAKRQCHGLETWNLIATHAAEGRFPKGTDVFLSKFQGLFYVAPAQDSYMCRLRFPGGIVTAAQFRGVADLAERYAGGYADVTTRANLQIREIGPQDPLHVLMGLGDLGIINRGAGADNIRNITASATAGIDPHELIDTRPLARQMHHYILNHREMYGLPRKFNIAFEGGGAVSSLAETNDIGFVAVRISEDQATAEIPAGVYFRMELGGITGHKDFSRDTGLLLRPEECISVATAVVRTFIEHGDRTNRNKARLKYLLDAWGFDRFIAEVQKKLPIPLRRFPLEACQRPAPADPLAHIGVHPQKQAGLNYIGLVLPVGRLTVQQMRSLADIAQRYGSGEIRLTVWQNLLIGDIADEHLAAVEKAIEETGLTSKAHSIRAGLVACTGSAGCKYAAANTKAHARTIADYIASKLELDEPVNIHLTGCHHSCAQHYIGDIGCLATRIARDDDMIEGYHVHVGGGHGEDRRIGRELCRDVPADELPALIERMLRVYLGERHDGETFGRFTARRELEELRRIFGLGQTVKV